MVTQASAAPELRLFASAAVAVEGEPFTFGVRRDGELDLETVAVAQVTDSAFPDFAAQKSRIDGTGNRFVVLREGDASGIATVTPSFDGERPASRTLTITVFIVNPPYAYGSPVTLTIPVRDRDAVLSRETIAVPGANDKGNGSLRRRLDAKLGYGIGVFGGRFVATPEVGAALSETDHELRLGWRLGLARSGRVSIDLDLEATRRESATGDGASGNGIGPSLTARW